MDSTLNFEQRHRLENKVLPDVIENPEQAASTIVQLEAKVERLKKLQLLDALVAELNHWKEMTISLKTTNERLNRLIVLANAYIRNLEEHEDAEGFSASTRKLANKYYAAREA